MAPCALRKKIGAPPTLLNARTGLCTPPGATRSARLKYSRELSCFAGAIDSKVTLAPISEPQRIPQRSPRNPLCYSAKPPRPLRLRSSGSSSNPQLVRITRAISDDKLRAGALEDVPRFHQAAIEIDQSVISQQREACIFTTDLIRPD